MGAPCRCEHLSDFDLGELVRTVEDLRNRSRTADVNWKSELASWLTIRFVDASRRDRIWPFTQTDVSPTARASRRRFIHSLNVFLTQISGPAALACEVARSAGLLDREASLSVESEQLARTSDRLPDDDPTADRKVGTILENLCLILLSALEARDDYEYDELLDILSQCDEMPFQFTTDNFVVFKCLKRVALAGQSRTKEADVVREYVSVDGWKHLSREIRSDSTRVHSSRERDSLRPCMGYPLLMLVSALGHMRRQHAATELPPKMVDFILIQLEELDACCPSERRQGVMQISKHHIEYYRYFALHVLAIGIVEKYPDSTDLSQVSDLLKLDSKDDSREDWDACASRAYEKATVSIERALALVPSSHGARRDYYDLTAENLEHEMSLRLEMLRRGIEMDKRVENLATVHVEKAVASEMDDLQEELRRETGKLHTELRSLSMRVIEIIGVFLAIVAFVATTVISGTAGDLRVRDRILILCIGGVISLTYFVLLRLIVLRPVVEVSTTPPTSDESNSDESNSNKPNSNKPTSSSVKASRAADIRPAALLEAIRLMTVESCRLHAVDCFDTEQR